VPSHLRPPAQAVNWVELSHDSEVDQRMRKQISTAIGLIQEVLTELQSKVAKNRLELDVRNLFFCNARNLSRFFKTEPPLPHPEFRTVTLTWLLVNPGPPLAIVLAKCLSTG